MLTRLIHTLRATFQAALADPRPNDVVPTLRGYPLARPLPRRRHHPVRRTS